MLAKIIFLMAGVLLGAIGASSAGAKDFSFDLGFRGLLAPIKTIHVAIADDVTGGCFTNSNAVKTAVELSLRRSGFSVASEESLNTVLLLSMSGFRTENAAGHVTGCAVALRGMLYEWLPVTVKYVKQSTFMRVGYYVSSGLYMGPNEDSLSIKSHAVEIAEKLANDILEARDTMHRDFPAEYEAVKAGLGRD